MARLDAVRLDCVAWNRMTLPPPPAHLILATSSHNWAKPLLVSSFAIAHGTQGTQ